MWHGDLEMPARQVFVGLNPKFVTSNRRAISKRYPSESRRCGAWRNWPRQPWA